MTSPVHRSFVHFDCVRVSAEVHRMFRDGEGSPGTERHGYRVPQAVLVRKSVVEQPRTPPCRGPGTSGTSRDRVHGHRVGSLVGDVKLPGICEVHPEGTDQTPAVPAGTPWSGTPERSNVFTVLIETVDASLDAVGDVRESVSMIARDVRRLAEGLPGPTPELTPSDGLPRILAVDPYRRFRPVLGDHQPVRAVHAKRRDVEELPVTTPSQIRWPCLFLLTHQVEVVNLRVQYKNLKVDFKNFQGKFLFITKAH